MKPVYFLGVDQAPLTKSALSKDEYIVTSNNKGCVYSKCKLLCSLNARNCYEGVSDMMKRDNIEDVIMKRAFMWCHLRDG